jgi:hypothetical protein
MPEDDFRSLAYSVFGDESPGDQNTLLLNLYHVEVLCYTS